jgi:diacylglycerol O-acyltransferase
VISNAPGPRNPLFLAGAQLQAHYPVSVVVDGVGLNITVMSYRDHLDFGIIADRDQVDDVWSMLDGLRDALAELQRAVGIEAKATAAGTGARRSTRQMKARAGSAPGGAT